MIASGCISAPRTRVSHGTSPLRRLFSAGTGLLRLWYRRARERRRLLQLDARLLRDIGVTADEARYEAAKPFWRG